MTDYVKDEKGRVVRPHVLKPTKTGKISKRRMDGRTDIVLSVVKIDMTKPVGMQLRALRKLLNLSERKMCELMDEPFNCYLSHWEKRTGPAKNVHEKIHFVAKYCRALGAKKIEITL